MTPRSLLYARQLLLNLVLVMMLGVPVFGQSVWNPVQSYPGGDIESILITDAGTLLVYAGIGRNRLYRSIDKGSSWTEIRKQGLLLQARNDDVLAFFHGGVIRSTDEGVTWSTSQLFLPNSGSSVQAAVRAPSGDLFVGTYEHGGFRSTDNGFSWRQLLGAESRSIRGFAFSDGLPYAGGDSGVFRSIDDGITWQQSRSGLDTQSVWSLAVGSNGHVYAGTNDQFVYRSADRGVSWKKVNGWQFETRSHSVYTIVALRDGSILAPSIGDGIYRSTDDGDFWERWDNGIDDPYNIVSIAYAPDGTLYTGGGLAGGGKLYSTSATSGVRDRGTISSGAQEPNISVRQAGLLLTVTVEPNSSASFVSIYDVLGQTVIRQPVVPGSAGSPIAVDLSGIPKGNYICRIATATGSTTRLIAVR